MTEPETSSASNRTGGADEPPYKGLRYFDAADAHRFFGREALTAKLVGLLSEQRFLAVVGASGSGKSSIVRAGLIPALTRPEQLADGTLPPEGSSRWWVRVITPTENPLEALAASLASDSESANIAALLKVDPPSLDRTIHGALNRTSKERLLLVVDQFEELFTLCQSDDERRAFVDSLMTVAATESPGLTTVVIVLRADACAHCRQFDNLYAAMGKWQISVDPLSADDLRRVIEEPARRTGWEFEAGLINLMLRDAGDEPGALPLLSHVLLATWNNRQGRTLTLEGYGDGIQGAIVEIAERVFTQQLKLEQQTIARNIFLQLTDPVDDRSDTRRRAELDELILRQEERPAIEAAIKILADARLVVRDQETVEVAHVALIGKWLKLRQWLGENRDGRRFHRQLMKDAQAWAKSRCEDGGLYRGTRLAQAAKWAEDHVAEMTPLERGFLEASRQSESESEAAKRPVKEQTPATTQVRPRNRYLLTIIGIALALIAAVFLVVQLINTQQLSRSRELAAVAKSDLPGNPARSLLIALEANGSDYTSEAEDVLRRALLASHVATILRGHVGAVNHAQFSPDGKWVVTAGHDGTARVWDISPALHAGAGIGQIVSTLRGDSGSIDTVQFSPNGKWIVTTGADKTVRVWEAATGRAIAVLARQADAVQTAHFSPGGKYIVIAGGDDKIVKIWEMPPDREYATQSGYTDLFTGIQFLPDGRWVFAAGNDDKAALARALETGRALTLFRGHEAGVNSAQFSPDGKWIVSASSDKTARIWAVSTVLKSGAVVDQAAVTLSGHEAGVNSAQFSPDGKWIVTASDDQTARVWKTGGELVSTLRGHAGAIKDAQFSLDGRYIVTAGADGTARVYMVSIKDLVELAKTRATRALTCDERAQYLHETECATPTPVATAAP